MTGSNGFLGSIIKNEFLKVDNIITLSRTKSDYNILLEEKIPEFNEKFDLIIHAAGKAHTVPKTNEERLQFHNVNVVGAQNLLKGLEKTAIPKMFIFISSVSVYGQEFGIAIAEESGLNAKDAYGLSKIEAENLIWNWCKANNVICTILRLPLLVGKNPPGNLGAMVRAIEKGYYFNIDGGKAKKSMVLVSDVAKLIPVVAAIGGIYNLTDGNNPSFSELSFAISKKKSFSLPLNLARLIGRLGDIFGDRSPINSLKVNKITSDLTFDDSKAKKILNWKPEPVLNYLKRENLN